MLDNARDAGQLEPLLPAGAGCCGLITSRQSLVTVNGTDHITLDVLPVDESVLLLGRIAGADRVAADPAAALHIAERCGYLPLALRIVGARLAARPSWAVRALADRLADVRQILDELHVGDVDARTSFQASYQILADSADPGDRAAAHGFALLGVPDGTHLSLAPAARLFDRAEHDAEHLLERLVDGRLLDSVGPGRYRLHDLLRAFARERAADRYAPSALDGALSRMLSWYAAATWQTFRRLRPGDHRPAMTALDLGPEFADADKALDWLDSERANLLAAVDQAARMPGEGAAIAVQLAQALFAYLHVRGHWHDLVSVNETARRTARQIGDESGVAQACRDLGAAHELIGRYPEALRYLRDGLAIFRELGDRHGQAGCLSSIGAVHDSRGNLDEAGTAIAESLQIRRELHDRHGQAISLGNLGPVYARSGDPEQAVTCLREAITIFRQLGNRAGEAASLNNLAEVYAGAGSTRLARQAAGEALTIFRVLADRFGEACALANLGRAHRGLGQVDTARTCWRAALEILERLGLDSPAAGARDDRGGGRDDVTGVGAHWASPHPRRSGHVLWKSKASVAVADAVLVTHTSSDAYGPGPTTWLTEVAVTVSGCCWRRSVPLPSKARTFHCTGPWSWPPAARWCSPTRRRSGRPSPAWPASGRCRRGRCWHRHPQPSRRRVSVTAVAVVLARQVR